MVIVWARRGDHVAAPDTYEASVSRVWGPVEMGTRPTASRPIAALVRPTPGQQLLASLVLAAAPRRSRRRRAAHLKP